LRRYGAIWFLLPIGSMPARIQNLCAFTSMGGYWPGAARSWRSRTVAIGSENPRLLE
jgi:hypothetical protein